jgi:hypothetical protein
MSIISPIWDLPADEGDGRLRQSDSPRHDSRALRSGRFRQSQHIFDRPNTCDGVLRERKSQRDRANQFPVDVHRTTTHTLDNSRLFNLAAGKTRQDHRLLRAEIFQNAENLHLKFFNLIARKYSLADSMLTGPNISSEEKSR